MDIEEINTIAVLGAGNMGHGIAEVAALADYDVRMRDINDEVVQDGYEQIEWSLGKLAEQEQISEDEADAALDRVTPLVEVEAAVADADVVIEAVPEVMDIKKDVYGEVESFAPDHAIFATNTSSLSITEIAEVTDRPDQFCGMHFFNPPIRMPLVEVISGADTGEETLETIEALAEDFGKSPVRVHKDAPGFIVNRVLVPLMNEAAWLVSDDVSSVEEVDATTKYDMGQPMGAFELGDMVGHDVSFHVLEYMHETLGDAYEPAPALVEKVENEEYGQKTGSGFYDYEDGDGPDIDPGAGSELVESRLYAAMANEVARLLGEEIATADAIDEGLKLGGGWPDGPVAQLDEFGVEAARSALEEAFEESGHERYRPSEHLDEFVEQGGFREPTGAEGDGERSYESISLEYPGENVGEIVIDRPHRMNTITTDMIEEIDDAIDQFVDDESVRAVLLRGAGDRAFSAGFDASTAAAGSGIEAAELSRLGQRVFGRLEEIPMPVVAAIDGYALGGGMELATCADVRIASERSSFGQPEHNLGLIPGWGGTQRLSRIVGEGRAKEIIFTARNDYDAETMADYGFVNEVVETDSFDERAVELAEQFAAGPPIAMKFTKRAMAAGRGDIDAGLEVESSSFGHLFTTDDLWEGLSAFQSDRDPEFEGK
ncbi:3-hydroxyacyl-CoA dehydrogenase/enoyl-CoA hydratase family protein [Halovivax gelatinilyticus]|uniref:3-hydroxyacyl-CoA dehydrogenase/enoyl-CoA hydratase family protein n=1 Tax=Halovivax gelatinilyticus TaxID=2961597 RepID=UPI0020CA8DCF|nr:3-hydroxyacyl-CoA dehydrogenase/enoyl-CoA hydratase family protein [Halovivax gelatinilyticus]